MKKLSLILKCFTLSAVCLLGGVAGFAQGFGGNDLLLLSGTDFTSSRMSSDTSKKFVNINEVDGFLGFITPVLSSSLKIATTTKSTTTSSDFLGKAQFAITSNPSYMDKNRLIDKEVTGFLASSTAGSQTLLQMTVAGLKVGSKFRVEIDYYMPFSNDYFKDDPSRNYAVGLRAVVNPDQYNPTSGTSSKVMDHNSGGGQSGTLTISDSKCDNCGDPNSKDALNKVVIIDDGKLRLNVNTAQGGLGQAIMITAIRVYGELDFKIFCKEGEEVCSGEQVTLSAETVYDGMEYQWYKDGVAIAGATSSTYVYETPTTKSSAKFRLDMKVQGQTIKSNDYTVKNDMCCEVNGAPASRKVIYKDDFGEFDLSDKTGHTYKIMDYSDIKNPVEVTKKTTEAFRYELDTPPLGCTYNLGEGGKQKSTGPIYDGGYTVAGVITGNNPYKGMDGAKLEWASDLHGVNNQSVALDNSGKVEGCALFINCKENTKGENIYYREIPGLCEHKELYFSCAYSVFTADGQGTYNPVNFVIELEEMDNSSNIVTSQPLTATSKKYGGSGHWEKSPEMKINLEYGKGVILRIINNENSDQNGNDLVLDDIVIKACAAPTLKAFFDINTFDDDTITCKGDGINVFAKPSKLLTKYFGGKDKTYYLYQYTLTPDDKTSWKNYQTLTQDTLKDVSGCPIFMEENPSGTKVYFRIIAGPQRILETTDEGDFNEDNPCSDYSISEPIECLIKCAECTKSAMPVIGTVEGIKIVDKEIHLCESDLINLNSNDIDTVNKDGDPSKDYSLTWYKGEIKTTNQMGKVQSDITAPNLPVSWMANEEDGSQYILVVHDNILDSEGKPTSCYTYDTITIYSDTTPKVPEIKIPEFCEGAASESDEVMDYIDDLISKLKDYSVNIVDPDGNDVTFAEFRSGLDKLEANGSIGPKTYTYQISLTNKDGAECVCDPEPFDVTVNEIPSEPTVKDFSYVMEAGATQVINDVVLNTSEILQWKEVSKGDPEPDSYDLNVVPTISLNDTAQFYYYVRQVSVKQCVGPGKLVVVSVATAPMPNGRDTTVCVNEAVDLIDLVSVTESKYELKWYTSKVKDGNGDDSPLPVNTAVPGINEFYVTQKSTEAPNPESEIRTITVNVIGVPVPDTTGNTYHYCENDDPEILIAKKNPNPTYDYSSLGDYKVMWSEAGGAASETVPTVDTKITDQKTKTITYEAYQTFDITKYGVGTCKSDVLTWDVEVTYVPAVTTSKVTYMKADAKADGTFDLNVMEQSENKAIANYDASMKLWWYEKDCETQIGSGQTAPSPKVDPAVQPGMDQDVYFCVRQMIDGCLSEGTPLHVVISDAPKPYVDNYVYCNGETTETLKARVNKDYKNADYILKWYGNGEQNDMTDLGLKGDEGPTPKNTLTAADLGVKNYYYYVTQIEINADGTEGAESNASEIVVTIYDQPQIKIDKDELKTVCKPQTIDISKSVSESVVVPGVSYLKDYYYDAALTDRMGSTDVPESGSYYVKDSFRVVGDVNEAVCVSSEVIPVTIDTLQVLVENAGTCPNMSATFTVNAQTNASGAVQYTWNGIKGHTDSNGGNSNDNVFKTSPFTMTNPEEGYGKTFYYELTVQAGTCKFYADTMKVTLGEGPVLGTMTITEDENTYEPSSFTDKRNEFYSCGGPLTIKAAYENEDGTPVTDYVWYDYAENGTQRQIKTGAQLDLPENREAGDRIYRLEFTAGCPTSVTLTIHNRPIEVTALSSKETRLCEGELFTAEIETKSYVTETPTLTWYLNGSELQLGGGVSLNPTKKELTIDKVATKDNGRYSVVMTNRGCTAKAVLDSLVAMPYIKATEKIDTIVPRNSNPAIALEVTVPANGTDVEYAWKGTRGESESTNPISLTDVVSDHYYNVTMKAKDHCDATATVNVMVDAKLTLKTTLKDTICIGTSAVLTIDTTGTGRFRHENWDRYLTVTSTTSGVSKNLTEFVTQDGDLLKLTVSPTEYAEYKIEFHYGNQDTSAVEKVEVIPAISVTIPDPITLCEGESADIMITDIQPEGTTIQWEADSTIVSETLDTSTVTVKPVYLGGTNHQYQYAYNFVAYNQFCQSSKDYTAYMNVDEPLVGEITGETTICQTFSSRIDASSYSATTYVWTLDGDTINNSASFVASPMKDADYKLSMDRGVCHKDSSFYLTVKTNPVIVDVDSVDIRSREILLKDDTGESPFQYWVDDNEKSKSSETILFNLTFSKHTAHVVDKNGCEGKLVFEVIAPPITIPPYFSPNADGIHDGWIVPELPIVYPNSVVKIYDRFGKLLIEYPGSQADGWDGTYNGTPMPSTDYWYVIDVEEIDRQFMGHFTLIRQ